jgi:hypothetical protein
MHSLIAKVRAVMARRRAGFCNSMTNNFRGIDFARQPRPVAAAAHEVIDLKMVAAPREKRQPS